MDIDLRKLRYFVAVAEHLNFGRAAAALHIAQPVLSRQIRALEAELHAALFVRDRRTTELTAAGRQLLTDAGPLLAAAEALRRRVGRAARGTHTFTVAFMPGLLVTTATRLFADAHPELRIDVLRTDWHDQTESLLDGRADIGLVRLPIPRAGLRVVSLLSEPRVAVLPSSHPLAGSSSVELSALSDLVLLQAADAVPEWTGAVAQDPLPRTVEEKLEHVAAGRGLTILPLSTARFYRRADVRCVAVRGLPEGEVGLAWDSTQRSALLQEFAALAEAHADSFVAGGGEAGAAG